MPGLLPPLAVGAEAVYRPVVLLTLTWAGRVWRVATENVEITNDDGEALPYVGTLDPVTLSDGLERFAQDAAPAGVPLQFFLPGVDVALRVAQGHALSDARGELAVWLPTTTFEERRELLSGRLREPEYDEDAPIRATLEEALHEDRALFPDPSAVVLKEDWNGAGWLPPPDPSVGRVYPVVIGSPGGYIDAEGTEQSIPGSPAICIGMPASNSIQLLIAGHQTASSTVTVFNLTLEESTSGSSISTATDGAGRTVSTTTVIIASTEDDWLYTHEYWIGWATTGGLHNRERSGPLTLAGEVIRWLLSKSSLPIDHGRVAVAARQLVAPEFSGYFDSPTSPWDLVRELFAPLLPITLTSGPGGLYPVVWRLDHRAHDSLKLSVARGDLERSSAVRVVDDAPVSVVRVRGAMEGSSGAYHLTVVEAADATDADDRASTIYARVAWERAGRTRREELIESAYLWSVAACRQVASYIMRRASGPGLEVSYDLHPRYEGLTRDWECAITDAGRHWIDRSALLLEIERTPEGRLRGHFWLPADPARTIRGVS